MNMKNRVVRLVTALSVAGLISAQIPMSGGTAMAADGYKGGGGGKFLGTSLTNEQAFSGVVLGVIGYSLLKTLREGGKVSGPAGGGDGGSTVSNPPVVAASDCEKATLVGDGSKSLYVMLSGAQGNSFSTLKGLIDEAGVANVMKDEGPFTVFAPGNGTLGGVPASALSALRADKLKLVEVISTHAAIGRYAYYDLCQMGDKNLLTLSGKTVKVSHKNGKIYINDLLVSPVDIKGENGYAHPLGGVIL